MLDARSAPPRLGAWLSMVGGALCVAGYFLPWVTYHAAIEGNPGNQLWSGWTTAWSGLQTAFWGIAPQTIAGIVIALLFLFPLATGVLALTAGARVWLGTSWSVPRTRYRVFAVLGALALLLMTYSLDPFGWSSETAWVAFHEPAPSIEAGFYLMCAGMLAILADAFLPREARIASREP
jgi:hypothetical protein